jgi:uracil-DNA glycosylase family 4
MLIGEAPGEQESRELRPFVGRSGAEQDIYLHKGGLADGSRSARITNVIQEYTEGNPDPTPAQIAEWTPRLIEEIHRTNPRLIVAVGRFAMRWLLGESADLAMCQGLPHTPGCFDKTRRGRAPVGCVVVPVQHPAAGMYDGNKRGVIAYGYRQAVVALKTLRAGGKVKMKKDAYRQAEEYRAVTGHELADLLKSRPPYIALDTEGSQDDPWSVQVSMEPGTGWVLRTCEPDFKIGMQALQTCADDPRCTYILHNLMHDVPMCRAVGLELRYTKLVDTMYLAYLLRLEPQGLKPLAWRWCGMRMRKYSDVIGGAATDRQIDYLQRVLNYEPPGWVADPVSAPEYAAKGKLKKPRKLKPEPRWPEPDPIFEERNDGTTKVRKPWSTERRVERILTDWYTKGGGVDDWEKDDPATTTGADDDVSGDVDSDGSNDETSIDLGSVEESAGADTDNGVLVQRWRDIDWCQREIVENTLGKFPVATLDTVPLDDAVRYAARDPDATLRVYYALLPEINRLGMVDLATRGMAVLPVFEEMQETGMPVSRTKLNTLYAAMTSRMRKLQGRISNRYFGGDPFNPKSTDQVATLIQRRGLRGAKLTKSGKVSTGKQAIEHLRYTDPAIEDVLTWREHQHTRDMFCTTLLAAETDGVTRCTLLPTRTTTRRLASKYPNLLAMPKHSVYGHMVRDCFECEPGQILAEYDLSQIESRGLAHESQDRLLCRLFHEDRDIHTETASTLFGISLDAVTKNQRTFAKRINFGIPYGASGQAVSTQLRMMGILDWDEAACNKFIQQWMRLYKGAAAYFTQVEQQVVATGYVKDHWGMRRYLPAVWSVDRKMSSEARRHAVNHRIQGLAQGMLQNSIVWLRPKIREMQQAGKKVRWSLSVHDSVVFWLAEEHYEELSEVVLTGLTEHSGIKLRVPVLAEGSKSVSWGGL